MSPLSWAKSDNTDGRWAQDSGFKSPEGLVPDASVRPVSKKRDDTSVLSGRSMREIADPADATWQSNRRGAA
jgi:hypothetical protein